MSEKMRLIHYSTKPLSQVYSRPHDETGGVYKTPGLWVSVEGNDDWVSWCRGEGWNLEGFKHATEITLAESAKVNVLSGARAIDQFTEEFQQNDRGPIWRRGLDWKAIRSRWQGLIIAPYCWDRRMSDHTGWYYGWDCASGVIWDADAVASVVPIDPPLLEEKAA